MAATADRIKVDNVSFEDFLSEAGETRKVGAQLHLYRVLHQLASRSSGFPEAFISYSGAKKLAARLGLSDSGRLIALFRDLGLGALDLQTDPDRIICTLMPKGISGAALDFGGSCDLERGLIDGAMERITGLPVTSEETSCWTRGDGLCRFEAIRESGDGVTDRFSPPSIISSHSLLLPGDGAHSGNPPGLRSWYLDLAGRELARARRHGRVLAVLYIDLDDLGEINRLHGRRAGDQVLGAVASALGKSCRAEDFIWHHGEDEFAVLLPETNPEGASVVAGRLRLQIVSAAELVDEAATVSASIGFASFPKDGDDITVLLAGARSAVYLAKAGGKGVAQAAGPVAFGPGRPASAAKKKEQTREERRDASARRSASERRETVPAASVEEETPDGAGEASLDKSSSGNIAEPTAGVMLGSLSPLLLAGMKQMILSAKDDAALVPMSIVAEITDPASLLEFMIDIRPDIILSDLKMATTSDFALPRMVKDKNLPCKLVVFVSEVENDVVRLVSDFGVDGVIMQTTAAKDAAAALDKIYTGRKSLPEEVNKAINDLEENRRALTDLSERELEVLKLVAEGKSNSQISENLFITVNTVRFHLANVYQKLGVSNRTEAANYFLRQGLTPNGQTKLL